MSFLPVQEFSLPPQQVDRESNVNRHSSLPLYYGGTPRGSLQDHINWFNSPSGFEFPLETRTPFTRTTNVLLLLFQLRCECREKMMTIERLVTSRCLPAPFRKDVGIKSNMFVSQMDKQLWEYFLSEQNIPAPINKKYNRSHTDHGFSREDYFHRVSWSDGTHPTLNTPHWYFLKWFEGKQFLGPMLRQ